MVESVRKLNAAKIPVVLASNPLPGQFVTYVGADDLEIGYREARYLFERLGGRGKIVVIEGTAGAPTNRERLRGYKRALAEYLNIEVLGSIVGNYQQADAKRAMETFLKEHPRRSSGLAPPLPSALRYCQAAWGRNERSARPLRAPPGRRRAEKLHRLGWSNSW